MQSVSSRIWIRVVVSISYDDNHYTTGTYCFYIGSNKVSIFVIQSTLFRCLPRSIKIVSYCYHIFIAHITIGKRGPVISWSFNCFLFFVFFFSYFCADSSESCWDDSVIGRYSFKRGLCFTVQNDVYLLFVYKYIIYMLFGKVWVHSFLSPFFFFLWFSV